MGSAGSVGSVVGIGLSAGAIGGIVAAVIVGAIIIVGGIFIIAFSRSDTLHADPPKLTDNQLELESIGSE